MRFSIFLIACSLQAAITVQPVTQTSPTGFVLNYSGMTIPTHACLIEVSQSPSFSPLHNDVDGSQFSGSNLDSRAGSLGNGVGGVLGNVRTFAFGNGGGPFATLNASGVRVSRAGMNNTLYFWRINNDGLCDSGGAPTGTAYTATYPLGLTYVDPVPADPATPGVNAFPASIGTSRAAWADPQTGERVQPVPVPGDLAYNIQTGLSFGSLSVSVGGLVSIVVSSNVGTVTTKQIHGFTTANTTIVSGANVDHLNGSYPIASVPSSTTFTIVTSSLADGTYNNASLAITDNVPYDPSGDWGTCAAMPCIYSGIDQGKLYLPILVGTSPTFENLSGFFLEYLNTHTPGSADATRTVNFQTYVGGFATGKINTRSFTTTAHQAHDVGVSSPGMTDWSVNPSYNQHLIAPRSGTFTSSGGGAVIVAAAGSFAPPYGPVMPITLNGSGCANIVFTVPGTNTDSDAQLTLSGATTCTSGTYSFNPFQLAIWAASSTSQTITLDNTASFDWTGDLENQMDSSPSQIAINQIGGPVITISGCHGYQSYNTTGWYWVAPSGCAPPNYIGTWSYNASIGHTIPDGQENLYGAAAIDPTTPGLVTFLTHITPGKTAMIKAQFSGPYTAVAGQTPNTLTPACGSSTPCLTFTTLTTDITAQLMADFPAYAADCCTPAGGQIIAGTCPDGTIMIQFPLTSSQGNAGWLTVFNPSTGHFVAARKSTDWYPTSNAGLHSLIPQCSVSGGVRKVGLGPQTDFPSTYVASSANFTGNGTIPMGAPWLTKIPGGMLATGLVNCPTYPGAGNTPIAPEDWPGGANNPTHIADCSSATLAANQWENPAPYALPVTATVAASGMTVTLSSPVAGAQWAGKPLVLNSVTYTINTYVDQSTVTITAPFSGSSCAISCSGSFLGNPPCSITGASCYASTSFALHPLRPGDKGFPSYPTSGHTVPGGGNTFINNEGTTEGLFVLFSGKDCSGTVGATLVCLQRNYGDTQTVQACPSPCYVTAEIGNLNFFAPPLGLCGACLYNGAWDTTNNPDGSLISTFPDSIDHTPNQGHATLTQSMTGGVENNGCPSSGTDWRGVAVTDCYKGKFGSNFAYQSAGPQLSQITAKFGSVLGIGNPGDVDTHMSYPYGLADHSSALPQWGTDGRLLFGSTTAPSTGTRVSGYLFKFTATQRGYSDGPHAVTGDKTAPVITACGRHSLVNVSGHGVTLGDTSADWYKFGTAIVAGDIVAGSAVGDLYVNCPGVSVIGSSEPAGGFTTNGGNVIDITSAPKAAFVAANSQIDFSHTFMDGSNERMLGYCGTSYRWYNPFWNVRPTTDGLGILCQAIGQDDSKNLTLLTEVPALNYDANIRTGFVNWPITIPANASFTHAQVEWGYLNGVGNPTIGQLYCTGRAENCRSSANWPTSGDPLYYVSETQVPTACSTRCTITLAFLPTHLVWYRVLHTDSSGVVKETLPVQIISIP